jgi:uncharacterized protein (DUF433 family)
MSETPREWKYLERRPGSSYQQLCIKGKRIWAWTLYCESFVEKEPRTPEQLAEDWDIPVEAVREAIEYCASDPPELREDKRKDDILSEAIGMNDPAIRSSGKPRPLPTEERARLGLCGCTSTTTASILASSDCYAVTATMSRSQPTWGWPATATRSTWPTPFVTGEPF